MIETTTTRRPPVTTPLPRRSGEDGPRAPLRMRWHIAVDENGQRYLRARWYRPAT